MAYSSRMGAIFNYINKARVSIMTKTLIACALLCASSVAIANPTYTCDKSTELVINMGDNQDDSSVTVNGIEYDYANSYAPRRSVNATMYEYSHNDHSVFVVIDSTYRTVALNYEGRNMPCVEGDVYE